jgi:hypothetical protein
VTGVPAFDLAAWNRKINETVPLANEVLALADEGKPGYDCKGFCALKASRLHNEHGYDWTRMTALSVVVGQDHHMVLQVDQNILDNLSPYLESPNAYGITGRIPALAWCSLMGML